MFSKLDDLLSTHFHKTIPQGNGNLSSVYSLRDQIFDVNDYFDFIRSVNFLRLHLHYSWKNFRSS